MSELPPERPETLTGFVIGLDGAGRYVVGEVLLHRESMHPILFVWDDGAERAGASGSRVYRSRNSAEVAIFKTRLMQAMSQGDMEIQ